MLVRTQVPGLPHTSAGSEQEGEAPQVTPVFTEHSLWTNTVGPERGFLPPIPGEEVPVEPVALPTSVLLVSGLPLF